MKKIFSLLLAVMLIAIAILPAAAASDTFVPSIDAKSGPTIIMQTDSKGNSVAAIVYDKDGHEVIGIPLDGIIVTPLAGANSAIDAIKEALTFAQTQITNSGDLAALTKEVNEYLAKYYPELNAKDLAVSQLFDVRLAEQYAQYLTDGAYFNIKLDLGESFLFLLLSQNKNWSLGKDYQVDGNIVSLNLTQPTQIALVKSNYSPSDLPSDKNDADNKSPQTGDYTNALFISLGVLFAVGAGLLIVMFVKSKQNKKDI